MMDGMMLQDSETKSELLLGCEIQSNLKWNLHIKYLQGKLKGRLTGLSSIKYVVPFQTRSTITIGMFNSVLGYCLPLFGGGAISVKSKILRYFKVELLNWWPCLLQDLTEKLNWLTVRQLISYHTLLMVYKVRQSKEPEYLANFLLNENRMGHIILPNTSLGLARKSFIWRGSETLNNLPLTIRAAVKISSFKKSTKLWVQENIPLFYD